MTPTHVDRGRYAEICAAAFLSLAGYRVLGRNIRHGRLEMDVLARLGEVLVVVEVKYRRHPRLGGAPAAVGWRKQRDLETAAVGYVQRMRWTGVKIRFDVVVVEGCGEHGLKLRHFPGAFTAGERYHL